MPHCKNCSILAATGFLIASAAFGQAPTAPSSNTSQTAAAARVVELQRLVDRGDYTAAEKAVSELRAQMPEPAGVERLAGSLYYAEGMMNQADTAYENALEQDPTDREAIQMRGMVLFRTGRPAEAIPYLVKANGWLASLNSDANYVLALCYMRTQQYDLSRQALAAIYSFPPESADAYLLAARMLLRQEFVPIAQQFAQKALQLKPNMPRAHQLLGEIALSQQDFDTAAAEFGKERDIDPLNPSIYDRLGDTYLRQQKYDDAQKALNRAILLDPYSSGPLILLGKTLAKRGDPVMAASFLSRAVHMDPSNYMAHNLLGQAYRAMGRTEDAARETGAAEKLQNGNTGTTAPQ